MRKLSIMSIVVVLLIVGVYGMAIALGANQVVAGIIVATVIFVGFSIVDDLAPVILAAAAAAVVIAISITIAAVVVVNTVISFATTASVLAIAALIVIIIAVAATLAVTAVSAVANEYEIRKTWVFAVATTGTVTVYLAVFFSEMAISSCVVLAGCVLIGIIAYLGRTRVLARTWPRLVSCVVRFRQGGYGEVGDSSSRNCRRPLRDEWDWGLAPL